MSDPLAAIRRLVEDIRPFDRQEEADRDHVASSSAGALCRKKGGMTVVDPALTPRRARRRAR